MDDEIPAPNSSTLDNLTTVLTTTVSLPTKPDYDAARYVYFYGLAVILPLGLVCNLLSFGVFLSSKSLRKTTTGHYLIALAFADTVFLFGELFRWMNSFDSKGQILGIDFMETVTFWCRTTFFLRYAGKLASAWITVIISAERFITVTYPLRVARISTPLTAKLTILGTFLLCCGFGAYPYWTLGLKPLGNTTYCGYTNPGAYEVWSMAVLRVGSLFVPGAIIIIFTLLIIVQLRRASKKRREQLEGQGARQSTATSLDLQLTIMLISVATAFVVLRMPYTISYYLNEYKEKLWVPLDRWFSYKIYLANKICDLIAISNYAVNFFLYCLCGSSFRGRLRKCFMCGKDDKKNKKGGASTGSTNLSSARNSSTNNKAKIYTVTNNTDVVR